MNLIRVHSQLCKLALVLSISIGLMALATSSEVQYTVYGQALPDVTPRGTSPLPPTEPTPAPGTNNGPPQASTSPTPTVQAPAQSPNSSTNNGAANAGATPPGNSGATPNNNNNAATPPPLVSAAPSGFEQPSPIRTVDTLQGKEGSSASITIGESSVTVTRPEPAPSSVEGKTSDSNRPITLEVASANGSERGADKELLPTNIAFSLRSDDKSADPVKVLLRYSDSQTAGIKEDSLSLYSYQNSIWTRVESCVPNGKDNTISCSSASEGTYVVAGQRPATNVALGSEGNQSERDTMSASAIIAILAAVGILFAVGTILINRGFSKGRDSNS